MQLDPRALLVCRCCARHVFADEPVCPFCGLSFGSSIGPVRALFAGGMAAALATTACGGVAETAPDGAGGVAGQTGGAQSGGIAGTGTSGIAGATSGGGGASVLPNGGAAGSTLADSSLGTGGSSAQDASHPDVGDAGPANVCPNGSVPFADVCQYITLYRSPPPMPRRA
jgi:hypothetical protein